LEVHWFTAWRVIQHDTNGITTKLRITRDFHPFFPLSVALVVAAWEPPQVRCFAECEKFTNLVQFRPMNHKQWMARAHFPHHRSLSNFNAFFEKSLTEVFCGPQRTDRCTSLKLYLLTNCRRSFW
jgi:hypothetical protein